MIKNVFLFLLSAGLVCGCSSKENIVQNKTEKVTSQSFFSQGQEGSRYVSMSIYVQKIMDPFKSTAKSEFIKTHTKEDGYKSFDEYWASETLLHVYFLSSFVPYLNKLATSMDINNDKELSKKELLTNFQNQSKIAIDGVFTILDKTPDGFLTTSELKQSGAFVSGKIRNYDKNKDGKISKDEYLEYIRTEAKSNYALKPLSIFMFPDVNSVNKILSLLNPSEMLGNNDYVNIPIDLYTGILSNSGA